MKSDREDIAFLLGLPFNVTTMDATIADAVAQIESRQPGYYVTANVDFIAQAYDNERLKDILFHADRAVCDGMPLVWLSRYFKPALPERVAGSDMVFRLFTEANQRGWKVYFLGSDDSTLAQAKTILTRSYPHMQVVGTFAPPFGPVETWPNAAITQEIRATQPDLLLVAVGCPKQEYWIAQHHQSLGVPLSIGIGASLDFICGKQVRAPKWMQKSGLEWFWRMMTDPKRLLKRYAKDFYFLFLLGYRQWHVTRRANRRDGAPPLTTVAFSTGPIPDAAPAAATPAVHDVRWEGEIDLSRLDAIPSPPDYSRPVLLDLSRVESMDSSGIGLLVKIARQAREAGRPCCLVNPSDSVRNILKMMRLEAQLPVFADRAAALSALSRSSHGSPTKDG